MKASTSGSSCWSWVAKRWAMQPPEFFQFAGAGAEDIYSRDIRELINPIRRPFFGDLLLE